MPDRAVIDRLDATLEGERGALVALSHRIHAHPEIRFEEHQASAWLAEALERRGFAVERGVGDLDTAFRATLASGRPGPRIALLCEYDALPGLGHACGHNLIATMGAGAAFALAPHMAELGGTLVVVGTPAEEGGGGKALLLRAGAFEGIDAALMIHPYHLNQASMATLASTKWQVSFTGTPAHAAMSPHLGRNALDAVRLAFAGIDALRQQVRDDVRMHAIITDGGAAANIIPESASMTAVARAADSRYLFDDLVPRLRDVFRGAALMTGTEVQIDDASPPYAEIARNVPLESAFERHVARRGLTVTPFDPLAKAGSTDMGNVSQVLPALHGMLAISDDALPHTAAFAEAARSPRGDSALLDGASILAAVAAELLTDGELLGAARAAFAETTGKADQPS
jgi:amidohydrolase